MSNVEQWDPLFPKYVLRARFLIIDPYRDEEMRSVVPLVHIATSKNNTLEEISSVDSRENSVLSGGFRGLIRLCNLSRRFNGCFREFPKARWETSVNRWGSRQSSAILSLFENNVKTNPVLITSHINTPWSSAVNCYLLICKSAYYSTSGWRRVTSRTPVISSHCVLQPCRQRAPTDLSWGLIYVPVMIMPAGDPYFINQMCSTHVPHHGQSCSVGRCKFRLTFFDRVEKLPLYKCQILIKTGFDE